MTSSSASSRALSASACDTSKYASHCSDPSLTKAQDINRLIPRDEMDLIKAAIESAVQKAKGKSMSCDILGSYRRGVPYSSDIDLVIRHKVRSPSLIVPC